MKNLNVTIKRAMANKAVEINGVDADLKKLKERRIKLAEEIRVDTLGGVKNEKILQAKVDAINEMIKDPLIAKYLGDNSFEPFSSGYEFYNINLAGMTANLQFNGDEYKSQTDYNDRLRKKFGKKKSYAAGHKFVEEFLSIEDDSKKLKARKNDLFETVFATLKPYRTVKKLLEEWPEAKELLPEEQKVVSLPALMTKDLNCLIGLPTDEN